MRDLSMLESLAQAELIKAIQASLIKLDVEYLKSAKEEMEKNQSFRESAMILDPSPFTANDRADLNRAKLKQLSLFIEAAENLNVIHECEIKVAHSKQTGLDLAKIFL